MIFYNSRGQALVESLFALPLAIVVVSSIFIGFLHLSSLFLTDHWTYQSSLCLASYQPSLKCKSELEARLQLLLFYNPDIQKIERRKNQVEVIVVLSGPMMEKQVFTEKLRLPLRAVDFRRS